MARRKGLGKGLDSLIPNINGEGSEKGSVHPGEGSPDEKAETKVVEKEVIKEVVKEVKVPAEMMVKVSDIEPNRDQPRKKFDREELSELADSIRQYGVIQPLVVQKKDDYYEIIAGERRWRAAKMAKIEEVPVVVKEYSPQEVTEIALIENIQREDLNPIEEARAYRSLMDTYGLKQEEVAKKVSRSRAAVANSLRLLKLGEDVQELVITGELSTGHARALLALENKELQSRAAGRVVNQGLSVRDTEKLVKNILHPTQTRIDIPDSNDGMIGRLQENLREIMGTKVSISQKKNGRGKIEIEYYSQDELDRIIGILNSTKN